MRWGGCLATIARNAACDYRRRARPVVEVHQAMASVKPTADAFAALDAIQALPEAYRETLCLRRIEGMTGPEIAERTGMTHESVRVNLCHGMNMLREKLT